MTMDPSSGIVADRKVTDRAVHRKIKRNLPLGLLLLGTASFFAFGLDDYLTFEMLRQHRGTLLAFVDERRLVALLAYTAIYAAVIALSLPGGTVMTIAGGFLFGVVQSSICVVIGATAGATVVFLVAKTALGDPLRAKAGPWLKTLERGFRKSAFSYLLFLRLMWVFPFFIVNLVPAFLGIPLRTYVAATAIGILPAVVVYSTVGAGLGSILDSGERFTASSIMTGQLVAGLTGLALLALAPVAYKKWKRRSPPEREAE